MSFKILYTKNDGKKRKIFLDGVCCIVPTSNPNTLSLNIYDESGKILIAKKNIPGSPEELSAGRRPSIASYGEEIAVGAFLVQFEQELPLTETTGSLLRPTSGISIGIANRNYHSNNIKSGSGNFSDGTSSCNGLNFKGGLNNEVIINSNNNKNNTNVNLNTRDIMTDISNQINAGDNRKRSLPLSEDSTGNNKQSAPLIGEQPNRKYDNLYGEVAGDSASFENNESAITSLSSSSSTIAATSDIARSSATSSLLNNGRRPLFKSNAFVVPSSARNISTSSSQLPSASITYSSGNERKYMSSNSLSFAQRNSTLGSTSSLSYSNSKSTSNDSFLDFKFEIIRRATTNVHYYTGESYCESFSKALLEEFKFMIYSSMKLVESKLLLLLNKIASASISSQLYKTILLKNGIALGLSDCEIVKQSKYIPKEQYFHKKRSNGGQHRCDDDDIIDIEKETKEKGDSLKLYLKFPPGITSKDIPKSIESLSKGDVWIMWDEFGPLHSVDFICSANPSISRNEVLEARQSIESKVKSGYVVPWMNGIIFREIFVFRSNWFGLSDKNMMEIDWLSHEFNLSDRINKFPFTKKETKLFGLRLFNDATTMNILDILSSGRSISGNMTADAITSGGGGSVEDKANDYSFLNYLRLSSAPAFINGILTPTRISSKSLQYNDHHLFNFQASSLPSSFGDHSKSNKFVIPKSSLPSTSSHQTNPINSLPKFHNRIIDKCVRDICEFFVLNKHQTEVIQKVGSWFSSESNESDNENVLLVHGVFGSGKSHLLVAVCSFLKYLKLQVNSSLSFKCLCSSNTNVAVDRILCGLFSSSDEKNDSRRDDSINLEENESHARVMACLRSISIARVGCPSKIDKVLRKRIVLMHENKTSAQKELSDMMRFDKDLDLLNLYNISKSSDFSDRQRRMVIDADVVGVTCASSHCSILKNIDFPILLLDEASQMTEPLSCSPIACSRATKIIVVGDPNQLPPVLSLSNTNSSPVACSNSNSNSNNINSSGRLDLSSTLFDRLLCKGANCIMLQTQYRCHPDIAGVCSSLFYGGMLLSGIDASSRCPLVFLNRNQTQKIKNDVNNMSSSNKTVSETIGLSPIVTLNCQGQVQKVGDSCVNYVEANLIKLLIMWIRGQIGNRSEFNNSEQSGNVSIGVICLYKSQSNVIRNLLGISYDGVNKADYSTSGGGDESYSSSGHANEDSSNSTIKVSTVDAFQGQELDIVIISTCKSQSTTFLSNPNRINVALSRAKHHVFIVGDIEMLQSDSIWSMVLAKSMIILDPSSVIS